MSKQPSPKSRKFLDRIRRHDSTEWLSPPKLEKLHPTPEKSPPSAASKAIAARAVLPKPHHLRYDSTDNPAKSDAHGPAEAPAGAAGAARASPAQASWEPWAAAALGLVARHACSLHPYSGEATPPRFGDYEAHRHWMEVTTSLPLSEWYTHDVAYWGLDYPPLMAYVEWALGLASRKFDAASVALDASRGYETPAHRAFMRATVLVLDAAVCVSALAALAARLETTPRRRAAAMVMALSSPALILVDHGHFQYNCLPLGLTLWCAYCVDARRPLVAAFFFSLALQTKQTALYYAPAVFCELLGRALRGGGAFQRPSEETTAAAAFLRVAALGAVVVFTTAGLWLPLLRAGAGMAALRRCFPVERGLFEDKVANAWYAAHVVLRVRDRIPTNILVALAAVATAVASFGPGLARCARVARRTAAPSLSGFLWALHASGLAFFLFSYHVHEKGVLVPLAPLLPLASSEPFYATAFSLAAAWTMLPLLYFEGLAPAYGALQALHALAAAAMSDGAASAARGFATLAPLHALPALVAPPVRYPDLYPCLVALAGAGGFALAFLYAAYRVVVADGKGRKSA